MVQVKWNVLDNPLLPSLDIIGNLIINGGFEHSTGGWNAVSQSNTHVHSGSYAEELIPSRILTQTFSSPIAIATITSFIFYVYGDAYSNGVLRIYFSDGSNTSQLGGDIGMNLSPANTWVENIVNLSSYAGKSIIEIEFYVGGGSDAVWLDDVSLSGTSVGNLILVLDEYNPNNPQFEVVFINQPERIIPIAPNVIKHEQDVMCEIYTKLIHYNPDDIENIYRPIILAMKQELTTIMNTNRFGALPIASPVAQTVILHTSWRDSKFPHGYGNEPEPISFVSAMRIQIHWYESIDGTDIGIRVETLDILGNALLGMTDIDWDDTDPWVRLQVPKGPLLEQHLLGPHIDGIFKTHDFNSLYTLLCTIPIIVGGSQYPVNVDNSKTKFSTNPASPQFIVTILEADGTSYPINFFNVRIKRWKLSRGSTIGNVPLEWTVEFMSDYVYYGVIGG